MKFLDILPFLFLLIFTIVFFGNSINKKLVGHHDWNSVVYASSARSLIGKAETGEIFYQQDYPALLPLILAVNFLIFGVNDWAVRLVPVLFTFLASLMIFIITRKIYGKKEAIAASLLYLNTPLIRYFGKIAVHETIIPFFALLVFYCYRRWFEKPDFKKYLTLLLTIFFAEQAGWPGYYLVPLLTFHYLFSAEKKRLSIAAGWWFISFISFGVFLFTDYLIVKKIPLEGLLEIFLTRTAFNKADPYYFTLPEFITREFLWLRVYLTRVLSILALSGMFLFIKENKEKNIFVFLMGIFGLTHLLLFRQLSWLHDYMIIYLFPFLVIISAKALGFFSEKFKINTHLFLAVFIMLMFLESRRFLGDLEKARDFYPAYRLGSFINETSKPGEKTYLASIEASKLYGVFFYYYANRSYGAGEPSLKEFLQEEASFEDYYRFFIVDQAHNRLDEEMPGYLKTVYGHAEVDSFLVFDLKNRI